HGALDGAMKFVRGDSIAGIVIIIINILGGLAIGVLQLGLPLTEAVRTYSILTIGDGLVGQIPALLSAIAAGLIVTRTAGEDRDAHLGASISRELRGHPRVLLTGGALALLLALVPGFPWPVVVVLGVLILSGVLWRYRHEWAPVRAILQKLGAPDAARAPEARGTQLDSQLRPLPDVILEIGSQLAEAESRERLTQSATQTVGRLREE